MNSAKNSNEINVTLTPYQVDFLASLLDEHLEQLTNVVSWSTQIVMVEGMVEQFLALTADLNNSENSFARILTTTV